MINKIRNFEELVAVGDSESRRIVLEIADATLARPDAYKRIKRITRLDRDILTIGTRTWDLSTKRNVYLIGAGKACNHMAMAMAGHHVSTVVARRWTSGALDAAAWL